MSKRQRNNFIAFTAGVLLLLCVTLWGWDGVPATLALEQEARCGVSEHTHRAECYVGDILVCGEKMHTHTSNCYLLLLEENNVDRVVELADRDEARSLEHFLSAALEQAAEQAGGTAEQTVTAAQLLQDGSAVELLNQLMTVSGTAMTFNANLTVSYSGELTPSDTEAVADDDTATVADAPEAGEVGLYIYVLDASGNGSWVCISTLSMTYSSRKYSVSRSDIISDYKSNAVISSSINLQDYLYYSTTSPGNGYDNAQKTDNGTIQFSNSNARYFYLVSRSQSGGGWPGGSSTTTTTPIEFYSVTLNYDAVDVTKASEVQYVQEGQTSTLDLGDYSWYTSASGGTQVAALSEISSTTTLYARPQKCTVTYYDTDGTTVLKTESVDPNTQITVNVDVLPDGYIWVDEDGNKVGTTATVTGNTAYYAVPAAYTVTFDSQGGSSVDSQTVDYQGTATEPAAPTRTDWTFAGWYTDADYTTEYNFSAAVTTDLTLYAKWTTDKETLTVSYDLNFTTNTSGSSVTTTINGTTLYLTESAPTVARSSVTVAAGNGTAVQNVSDQNIVVGGSASPNRFSVIHFQGWLAEDGTTLIEPGTLLDWSTLSKYDADGDGTVSLTASWHYVKAQSVDFFVIYNSKNSVEDANSVTSSAYYTGVVFSAWVGGVESDPTDSAGNFRVDYDDYPADSKPTTYELDQQVRALYGEKESGAWLSDFPSDEAVFEYLRTNYPNSMSIEGESIPASDLTTEKYTIRWYKFKYVDGDGNYHIDGVLVKKKGQITVDKEFYGVEAAIEAAESGFYIVAQNGTKDSDGNFTAYTSSDSNFKQYVLVLDETTRAAMATAYPNATGILLYDEGDPSSHAYEWLIEGVELGEYWQITEYPPEDTDSAGGQLGYLTADGQKYIYYAEYSVYDTDGVVTSLAEYGTTATATGKTFALDEDPDQGLLVDFRNYYYTDDSLFLKKEDGATGKPIGGAEFELWQWSAEAEDYVKLKFSYDAVTGQYKFDSDGTISTISTGDSGFTAITVSDFSYAHGDVLVKEITAPGNYDLSPNVILRETASTDTDGNTSSTVSIYGTVWPDGSAVSQAVTYYAELEENGNVLVIKDYSSKTTTVTVTKEWEDPLYTADSVTVVLQANGTTATNVFPSLVTQTGQNVSQTLSADNNWTFTWENLPAYANGQPVTWSVKEVNVGGEVTLADGVSFANWVVVYSTPVKTDLNADGIPENWAYTVTNRIKRPMLVITKTDGDGAALTGAEFTLTEVTWDGSAWTEQTTDYVSRSVSGNVHTFDNLTAGRYYKLTETVTPSGYWTGLGSVILSVDGEGKVQQAVGAADGSVSLSDLTGDAVRYTGAYNLTVVNETSDPLPSTGGAGSQRYIQAGLLLMAAAVGLYAYTFLRRREDEPS